MVIIVAYELQYSVDFAVSTLWNFTQKLLDTQSIYLCIQLAREWKGQKAWHIGTKQVIETRIADLTRKAVKELLAQKNLHLAITPQIVWLAIEKPQVLNFSLFGSGSGRSQ